MLARISPARGPDAHHQWLAAGAQGAGAAGTPGCAASRSASTRSTTRRSRAMNDVGFPVQRVLEGIDAAAAAGLAPIKVNMVVKRGVNEHSVVPMARHFRGSGHVLRFIEYMDVGHTQRLADGRRGAGGGDRRDDRRRVAARAGRAELPRARSRALALHRRQRRDRRDRLGDAGRSAAPAPARGCRPTASSSPACSPSRATTCARCCATARPTRRSPRRSAASGACGSDRYSEMRTAATARLPKVEMSYIGG